MNELRDAETAPSWPPQDQAPPRIRTYSPQEVLSVRLQVDGVVRTGIIGEHADHAGGRRSVHLHFTPVLHSGERDRWVWWDATRMCLRVHSGRATAETPPVAGDAIQVPAPGDYGPHLGDAAYPVGQWPAVDVRVGGSWRPGQLLRRSRWAGGRTTAVVWVVLDEPDWGAPVRYSRTYWWNPSTIRLRDARQ